MQPSPEHMKYCITDEHGLVDGAHGLAIGDTEMGAWERAIEPCEDWSVHRAKSLGMKVTRCAIMLINP